jgi:hypothetical protein
LINQPLID